MLINLIDLEYVPHKLDKFQKSIDFVFYRIWCKAKYHKNFSLELLNEQEEFKQYILEVKRNSVSKDYFIQPMETIFNLFKTLNDSEIIQLQKGYQNNNYRISELCKNNKTVSPITIKDLEIINKDLSVELKNFFLNLYDNVFKLATTNKYYEGLLSHHNAFKKKNRLALCPFCGLNKIIGITINTKRNPYDHYLPKSKYIFNSVNPKNLAPICHACNSTFKLQKNPLEDKNIKRKAFYIFMKKSPRINMEINKIVSSRIGIEEIIFKFESEKYQEEVDTWNELFEIDTRYNDYLITSRNPENWIKAYFEYKSLNKTHTKENYIKSLIVANNNSYSLDKLFEIEFIKRYRL